MVAIISCLEKSFDFYFSCLPRTRPSRTIASKACLIAHRGAHETSRGIIENTQAAFRKALELGCWGIEFDVHATADGVLVVNHDPTLTRLWGNHVKINELTFQQLRQLVPEVPSLAEVVQDFGKKLHLFIELKAPFTAEAALIETLKPLKPSEDYHLISLDESSFDALSSFSREIKLLVPVHNNVKQFCQLSLQKYGGILGHYLLLTNRKINPLRSAQQLIGVGFVDSKYSLYRELNRGVEWIFTNNARKVAHYLNELRKD